MKDIRLLKQSLILYETSRNEVGTPNLRKALSQSRSTNGREFIINDQKSSNPHHFDQSWYFLEDIL